jgi:hypothetical protein
MRTTIETIHEEQINDKILGILLNIIIDNNDKLIKETFIYMFTKKRYIFFNTITDCVDYSLYGEKTNVKRAYMEESDFDSLYEKQLNCKFNDVLEWQIGE